MEGYLGNYTLKYYSWMWVPKMCVKLYACLCRTPFNYQYTPYNESLPGISRGSYPASEQKQPGIAKDRI